MLLVSNDASRMSLPIVHCALIPTPACKNTTNTAEYAAVAARDSYNRDRVTASTTKKTTMKHEMTASRYGIGLRYANIQMGPISIASPTTEIVTEDTFSIL
jgi:hypothetical protein